MYSFLFASRHSLNNNEWPIITTSIHADIRRVWLTGNVDTNICTVSFHMRARSRHVLFAVVTAASVLTAFVVLCDDAIAVAFVFVCCNNLCQAVSSCLYIAIVVRKEYA